MPLTALDLRPGPASSVPNVLCLPEACPNHGKSRFSRSIKTVLEPNSSTLFMKHRRAELNRSFQPRFLSSPTVIENP
jgi:hypothetical protein